MATAKLVLDTRNKEAKKFPLVIRVSHRGKWKYLKTGYRLAIKEWNEVGKKVQSPYPNITKTNAKIQKKKAMVLEIFGEYESVIKNMTLDEIVMLVKERFEREDESKLPDMSKILEKNKTNLKSYGEKVIARYAKTNRFGMVNSFKAALVLFLEFSENESLYVSEIDETFLEDLEAYYISKGNSINGLGVHLRSIRRIFNLAIKDKETELTLNDYPFGNGGYSIKTENTKKRAVKLDVIQKIRELDYPEYSPTWHHRNYFMFMFNMRGMNFIDLAFLPVSAVKGDRLTYKRKKTKHGQNVQEFNIKITEEAQMILNYYNIGNKKKTDLIFPIMADVIDLKDQSRIHTVYTNRIKNHNRRLNTIRKAIKLDTRLTTYVARHTFATAGLHKGISKAQIGDMLGHTSYYTTEAYLSGFDQEILDDAADKILG